MLYAEMAEAGIDCLSDEIVIKVSDSDLLTVTALVPGALHTCRHLSSNFVARLRGIDVEVHKL